MNNNKMLEHHKIIGANINNLDNYINKCYNKLLSDFNLTKQQQDEYFNIAVIYKFINNIKCHNIDILESSHSDLSIIEFRNIYNPEVLE